MAAGDGGGAADIMNSLAPLLQHIAGALQQSGDPTPVQQQVCFLPSLMRMYKREHCVLGCVFVKVVTIFEVISIL